MDEQLSIIRSGAKELFISDTSICCYCYYGGCLGNLMVFLDLTEAVSIGCERYVVTWNEGWWVTSMSMCWIDG